MENLFSSTPPLIAAMISIGINILVAISGVLPSTFITIATVGFFGFQWGLIILIIGEALGAIVSFILYRKGIQALQFDASKRISNYKYMQKLKNTAGINAIFIILLLRVIPFVPSGAVTFTAALSKINLISFCLASTIGKIPALWIEAYSVAYVLVLQTKWQIIIVIGVLILFFLYRSLTKVLHRQSK